MTIRLATWNLRFDSQPDTISISDSIANLPDPLKTPPSYYPNTREQPWSTRRLHVARSILFEKIDIIGFQEALIKQVHDLHELLGVDEWDWVGVGRDDGKKRGEFGPIFYKKSMFKLKQWDTFWLSQRPFEVSKYPDAGSFRICTTAQFQCSGNSSIFTMLNTHLDERSDSQRRLGASELLLRARYEAATTESPVFVMGDFNSPPTGEDSRAYQIITGAIHSEPIPVEFSKKYGEPSISKFKTVDLRGETPRHNIEGHFATFTGFNQLGNTRNYSRIDFILGGSNGGWKSTTYKVPTALYDDGVYQSDHRPVIVDIKLIGESP